MKVIMFLISFCLFLQAKSQKQNVTWLEVGKAMPDFQLADVHYFQKQNVKLKDFKDRWLILDFFGAHCGTCFESMPKTDSLRKIFSDRIDFLMVGYTGSQYSGKPDNKVVQERFERIRENCKLNLPIAYDSVLAARYDIWVTPYIVVVDAKGIIRGITYEISRQNLEDMLNGKPVTLPQTTTKTEQIEKFEKNTGRKWPRG